MKKEFETDYLSLPGVYFLRLEDGYYIDETNDLFSRLSDHLKSKAVSSITLATTKSKLDLMDKEKIRDLESLLISFANDQGLTLGNIKDEKRKVKNALESKINMHQASYIWDQIAYLNIKDILEETKSQRINEPVANNNKNTTNHNYKKNTLPIESKNIRDKIIDLNDDFFKHVKLRAIPSIGYNKEKLEIFNKEFCKKALMLYLYNGVSNMLVDEKLTNGRRKKGYLTAVTLAYFRIESNGSARGSLKNTMGELDAQNRINIFVNMWY